VWPAQGVLKENVFMSLLRDFVARMSDARRVVVFTGAGVSQESGLDVFRGTDGTWSRVRPEDFATPEAFARDPRRVWAWYTERFAAMRGAAPNAAHRTIASWQERFPSLVVVTQNVDRLHQRAGSRHVLELHGTIWDSHCGRCGRSRPTAEVLGGVAAGELPAPCGCGGLLRPSVVWFGEALPAAAFGEAAAETGRCDAFLVVGTSAVVWPAAGLIELAANAGALVVEVNREPSALSALADVALTGAAGDLLPRLDAELAAWRSRS
jgi:NAD-dependent deacetylase